MSLSQRIRILSEAAFTRQSRQPGNPPAPDMRPFLSVQLPERMVLLALYDGQSMEEIKAAYPWAKETDVRLTSHRIQPAIADLIAAVHDPTAWIRPGPIPEVEAGDLTDPDTPDPINHRRIPADVETQLRQAFFPSVPLMLFGAHVPPEVGAISLQHRAVVYLVVVVELPWSEVMRMMGCSKRQIHNSLVEVIEALGG